ncbi:hypothetical protein [Klebsiella pneumoniae]
MICSAEPKHKQRQG